MPTSLETDPIPDSPEWWNRQLVYIMNESFHALKNANQKGREEDWIKRAEYLRNKAIECVENAYNSIQLQIEEEKE